MTGTHAGLERHQRNRDHDTYRDPAVARIFADAAHWLTASDPLGRKGR
jgi:hypothetical protein